MTTRYPRRIFLRGLGGIAISLPLLEFTQAKAYGQAAGAPPLRFITFFEHGGTLTNHTHGIWEYGTTAFTNGSSTHNGMDGWRPTSRPGQPLVLGPIHKPLADAGLTENVNVIRGIDNNAAVKQGDYGSGHGISNVTILTAAKAKEAGQGDDAAISQGPSIDQYIASKWGPPPGGVAAVNLCIDAHNYGSPYFKGPKQYASLYYRAQDAFNSLLAGVQTGTSGPDPAAVRAQNLRRSILDGTSKELSRYKNQLTSQDKVTVEAHLEHVRTIEQRLAATAVPPSPSCSKPTITSDSTIPQRSSLMVDIALAALRCGVTRVLSIEIGDFHMTWDPTPIPFEVGYNIGHSLGHMGNEVGSKGPSANVVSEWQQCMIRNRQFRAGIVAKLLKGLKDTPEGNGDNMLKNSLFFWTSEFSNGGSHLGTDMPMMVAGNAGGKLGTGRYLNYNTQAATDDFTTRYASVSTTNNLYISMLNTLGINDTTFGDMSYAKQPGPLAGFL